MEQQSGRTFLNWEEKKLPEIVENSQTRKFMGNVNRNSEYGQEEEGYYRKSKATSNSVNSVVLNTSR